MPATPNTSRIPSRRFPPQDISSIAQNTIKKKRGPKPKPLSERPRKWAPPAQRVERSYARDKKLRVLGYWFYALVPDEKRGGLRHVT